MANVYSTLFIRGIYDSPHTATYTVPAGFVAVIRDIQLFNGGTFGVGLFGCQVYDDSLAVVFAVMAPIATPGNPYNWEGRAVMNAGETLTAQPLDGNWHIRISGYLLTLP